MFAADSKVVSAPTEKRQKTTPSYSWKQIIDPVEPFLEAVSNQLARQVESFDPAIAPYADYALNGQGKHLRPALVALTAESLGNTSDAHIKVAVIIEMVHLATLVHDDIMDEAEIRRSRLTLAANWGNDIAVLFGDCLFANALRLAASFPTTEVCRAVSEATNTVCSGEILQTQHKRDFNFTRDRYFKILEMKTAELFALSCDLSAFISGATDANRKALHQFGLEFGSAYQLYDDCVDLFGSEAVAGKSLGTDMAKGKLTLPLLLARDRANPADKARLKKLTLSWEPGFLPELVSLLSKYETLSLSVALVHEFLARAKRILDSFPGSDGRTGLIGLTEYLSAQSDALEACT